MPRAAAFVAIALAGCTRGCGRNRDRPYTPYAIDSAPSPNPASVAVPDASFSLRPLGGDAGGFVHVVGQRPDQPGGAFRLEGSMQILPPPGEAFILAFA